MTVIAPFPFTHPLYPLYTEVDWAEVAEASTRHARRDRERAAESFERCDTDGYLSQWASDSMARERDAVADWALARGTTFCEVLLNLDGSVASSHPGEGQWGQYWVLNDVATAVYGKRFFAPSKAATWSKQARANAKRGFRIAQVQVCGTRPKLRGENACSLAVVSTPCIESLRAGQWLVVHEDWLMELQRRDDEWHASRQTTEVS